LGNNLLELRVLGEYLDDLIRNSKFSNVIDYCIYFEERGREINSSFYVIT